MTQFNKLNISSEIMKAVEEMGYENATDIQTQSIPLIMEGKDVLGRSNTGTGKTAAFGIPAIESVDPNGKLPQILIICPTRELVTQVATEMRKFAKYKLGIKIVPIYGGQPIDRQIQLMKRGCGIIVGTPGRIMDHLNRKTLKLDEIKMVILDEADEMLNMGFKEDIEEILTKMPEENKHQTILFSATMPSAILKITKQFQNDPVTVEIKSTQRTIDTVEQIYYDIPRGKKTNALRVLLNHYDPELCMIFCNTKRMVDELNDELNNHGIKAISLHGDMKQEFRSRVMDQFRSGKYPILIATDVAARGIDVDNITLVVNFDVPQDNEYYIHRIGRTGRAGKSGKAITLISGGKQRNFIKDIIRYTKTNIVKHALPTSVELMQAGKDSFINDVKVACNDGITEESMEIANELMSEGIARENIISALVSMIYKHEIIDLEDPDKDRNKGRLNDEDVVTLKINLGRASGIKPGHIVCAISEETGLSSKVIGHIDLRPEFTLVDVERAHADKIVAAMNNSHIKGQSIVVSVDDGPRTPRQGRDGGGSRGRDRDRGDRDSSARRRGPSKGAPERSARNTRSRKTSESGRDEKRSSAPRSKPKERKRNYED